MCDEYALDPSVTSTPAAFDKCLEETIDHVCRVMCYPDEPEDIRHTVTCRVVREARSRLLSAATPHAPPASSK